MPEPPTRTGHVLGDGLSDFDGLGHPHDLGFLANALVEQRRDRKTDQKRQYDANHADNRSILEKAHSLSPPLIDKR